MRKKQPKKDLSAKTKIALVCISFCLSLIAFLLAPTPQVEPPIFNNLLLPSETNSSAVETEKYEKIEFTVTVICGGKVVCKDGLLPLKKAIKYLESRLELSFKIENVLELSQQPKGTLLERWNQWLGIASSLEGNKSSLTVILLENYPVNVDTFDFQEESILGLASGIAVLGVQPASLLAKVMGSEQFMTRLLIHEIGHVLGGEHIEEGIMHPCACVNQYSDELSNFSLNQIQQHLKRLTLLKLISEPTPESDAPKSSKMDGAIVESMGLGCKL